MVNTHNISYTLLLCFASDSFHQAFYLHLYIHSTSSIPPFGSYILSGSGPCSIGGALTKGVFGSGSDISSFTEVGSA